MVEKYREYIENISKETGFIQSTLEKVERLIRIIEWMNGDENEKSNFIYYIRNSNLYGCEFFINRDY